MNLRLRITAIAATAVALAVVAASIGLYLSTARTLRGSVDQALLEIARGELTALAGPDYRGGLRPGRMGGPGATVQVVTAGGITLTPAPAGQPVEPLPVSPSTIEVASGRDDASFETVDIDGERVRVLAIAARPGVALQLARPLTEVDDVLDDLRGQLILASLAGIALAALLGAVVANRAVRPVGQLTDLAEEVARTQDLSRRLAIDANDDEVGRLAAAFDGMLAQLEQARWAQEQLIADASHELRTPLTSLRTNIEVLAHAEQLGTDERRALIGDVIEQIDGFSQLIGGLIELARGATPLVTTEPVRIDDAARRVAARLDPAGRRVVVSGEGATVVGDPDRLERAIANVVENALKHAPQGTVEVRVSPGTLTVRDHGPGIPEDERARVFDRFYRSPASRATPGSGLGLSIVKQIVTAHGGDIDVADAPGGGTVVTMRLAPTI